MTAMPDSTRQYLEALPEAQRQALEALRETIIAAAPEAEEAFSYGVPTFKLNGALVSFGAAKAYCAFYVQSPAVSKAFAKELEGLDTSPGTVRFTPDKPLPKALVTRLVEARIAENNARIAARKKK